jgi:O-antigen ligase
MLETSREIARVPMQVLLEGRERPLDRQAFNMLSAWKSYELCRRFGWLGLLAILTMLPYSIPAFYDVLRVRRGAEAGTFIYLLKPVENQLWFLVTSIGALSVVWWLWKTLATAPPQINNRTTWIYGLLAWALLAAQFVSAVGSDFPVQSCKNLMLPGACLLAFVMLLSLRPSETQLKQLFLLLVIAAMPACLYAIAQNQGYEILPYSKYVIEGSTQEISGKQAIASVFGHPNYMGSYMAPLLFWPAFFALNTRRKAGRWIAGIAGIIMIVTLIVGGTRGPWLAVGAAALPYYFMLALSPRYRRQLLFAAGLAIVTAIILLAVPNPFFTVQFDVSKRLLGSKEISSRFYYWLMAIEMWKVHPWLGVGYGRFDVNFWDYVSAYQQRPESEYVRYVLQETIRGVRPGFVHNDHLQILAEGGVLATALWLALWSLIATHGLKALRALRHDQPRLLLAATLLASMIAFGADGLFNFPFHIPCSRLLFWITLASWVSLYGQFVANTNATQADSDADIPSTISVP